MKTCCIQVAGFTIELAVYFSPMYKMCKSFLCDNNPIARFQCTEDDFYREAELACMGTEERPPSPAQLEPTILLRKVAKFMLDNDVLLIHAVALAVNGDGYLFAGPSGIGKTTHALKWIDHLRGSATIINGDKPFIKFGVEGAKPFVCGSPWCGKECFHANSMVPLKSISLLNRAQDNTIERISFERAFPTLLSHVYRPDEAEQMRKTLQLLLRIRSEVDIWQHSINNNNSDAFEVAYKAMCT